MSVYTTVSAEDLDAWLARYTVGALVELKPIASGIENTNYFVTTVKGRYVLTLYERLPAEDLPFYLNLMAHLARSGCEVPAPEPDRTGALFSIMNGKPAGLVARVEGAPVERPDAGHCRAVGGALARMHVAAQTYRARLANRRGPAWWRQAARAVRPFLTPAQDALLQRELAFQQGFAKLKLPKAAIHADLFCDNVLFAEDAVAGIIDFGFAATDFLAYDVAIAVNDWCDDGSGGLVAERAQAFLSGYHAVRPLTDEERTHWPDLLRAAALRFWLSRLYDLYLPRPGELTHAHDPSRFEHVLAQRAQDAAPMPALEPRASAGHA
jgi:homoserine kinase type II